MKYTVLEISLCECRIYLIDLVDFNVLRDDSMSSQHCFSLQFSSIILGHWGPLDGKTAIIFILTILFLVLALVDSAQIRILFDILIGIVSVLQALWLLMNQ